MRRGRVWGSCFLAPSTLASGNRILMVSTLTWKTQHNLLLIPVSINFHFLFAGRSLPQTPRIDNFPTILPTVAIFGGGSTSTNIASSTDICDTSGMFPTNGDTCWQAQCSLMVSLAQAWMYPGDADQRKGKANLNATKSWGGNQVYRQEIQYIGWRRNPGASLLV